MNFVPISTKRSRVVFDGNSICAGSTLANRLDRYSDLLLKKLGAHWDGINCAYPGISIVNPETPEYSMVSRYSDPGHPGASGIFLPAPARSMAIVSEFANEPRFAESTVSTLLASLAEYVALLRATGYAPIYTIGPVPYGTDAVAKNQMRSSCAIIIRNSVASGETTYGDRMIDVSAMPIFQDTTNTDIYPDGIHWSPLAHYKVFRLIYECMMDDHLL